MIKAFLILILLSGCSNNAINAHLIYKSFIYDINGNVVGQNIYEYNSKAQLITISLYINFKLSNKLIFEYYDNGFVSKIDKEINGHVQNIYHAKYEVLSKDNYVITSYTIFSNGIEESTDTYEKGRLISKTGTRNKISFLETYKYFDLEDKIMRTSFAADKPIRNEIFTFNKDHKFIQYEYQSPEVEGILKYTYNENKLLYEEIFENGTIKSKSKYLYDAFNVDQGYEYVYNYLQVDTKLFGVLKTKE
jgi:hypothetical protein